MYHPENPLLAEMLTAKPNPPKPQPAATEDPQPNPYNLFTICTARHWIQQQSSRPQPKRLFGEFWRQHELCILFADTNAGKSVLAVQIGNSLTRCEPIGPFAVDADPARVLYVDFELSSSQFAQRYNHQGREYDFSSNFTRAEFNPLAVLPDVYDSYEDYVIDGLAQLIRHSGAAVLIIDNITALSNGTGHAAGALWLIKSLQVLKAQYNLSVLVLAHTPKRDAAKPITVNHLHGSKMLSNLADSAFAIGRDPQDAGLHYLKQLKQRSTAQHYGPGEVCLCRLHKPGNFLHFKFEGRATEQHLLNPGLSTRSQQRQLQAKKLRAQGLSQRSIARQLNMSKSTVNKYLRAV